MLMRRSLGGIGALYRDNELLGKVYYNLKQNQSPDVIVCTIVFVGDDVELPNDDQQYRLWLEDGQYLLLTLHRMRDKLPSPYVGFSSDRVFHAAVKYLYSGADE